MLLILREEACGVTHCYYGSKCVKTVHTDVREFSLLGSPGMTTPLVAAGAAAAAYFLYLHANKSTETDPSRTSEAWSNVEHPPSTRLEALYYFKDFCRCAEVHALRVPSQQQ
jgi:hypothetical protein